MSTAPFAKLQRRIQRLPKFFEALCRLCCEECVEALKANTPGKDLPKEWEFDIKKTGNGIEGRVFSRRYERSDADWALILSWLNTGTKAHWIFPVVAQALHWIDPDTGEHRFSKGHEVSGIQPSLFAEKCDRAIRRFERKIPWLYDNYMSRGKMP